MTLRDDWRNLDQEELERQYDARASVPDFDAEIARYRELSAECHADCDVIRDLAYGPSEDERIDYFPAGSGKPVLVFLHGGYWRLLGRTDSAFMAKALVGRGISTAVVEYSLAPKVSLDVIVAQCRRAVAWIHGNIARHGGDPTRLFVCGSSAGAQLAAMALATDWSAFPGVPRDVLKGGVLASGLYDLEPVRHCRPNEWLGLDAAAARRNSPQGMTFPDEARLLVTWGGLETDEFKRQSRDFARKLHDGGLAVTCLEVEDRNHFDVVTDLADPGRRLHRAAASLIDGCAAP